MLQTFTGGKTSSYSSEQDVERASQELKARRASSTAAASPKTEAIQEAIKATSTPSVASTTPIKTEAATTTPKVPAVAPVVPKAIVPEVKKKPLTSPKSKALEVKAKIPAPSAPKMIDKIDVGMLKTKFDRANKRSNAMADARKYQKEADYANSPRGFTRNFVSGMGDRVKSMGRTLTNKLR